MTYQGTLDIRPPAAARTSVAGRRSIWSLLVLAGWLAQIGIRLLLAGGQSVPAAFPDESGYLIAARWLAGGPGGDLSGSTFYQGGYPLLLTPAFWLSHDPQTCYRIVVGIGALVGAGVFPLGHTALRRLGLGPAHAYGLAFAAALLPAATVFGPLALTDAILPTLLLAWLLALHTYLRARGRRAVLAGSLASLAAAYAYTTHARGSVVLAVHLLVLAGVLISGLFVRRTVLSREAWPELVPAIVAVAGAGAGWTLNSALRAALYPGGVRDLGGLLSTRLSTVAGLEWTVFGAAGQVWYLIVGTWGLAGIGLVAEVRALFRRGGDPATRIMSGVLLAATFGTALASSAALPDEHRVGNFVYGRYLACLAVAHALAGLATLVRRRGSLLGCAVAAAVVLTGAGLAASIYAGDRLSHYTFVAFDFPETSFLTWDWTSLRVGTASLMAIALLWLLVAVAFTPRPARTIAAGLAVFNLFAAVVICKPGGPHREPIFRPGPARGSVAVDASLTWRVWVRQTYQVWWTPITFFHAAGGEPPAGVCMVIVPLPEIATPAASWPRHPAGWRVTASGAAPAPWAAWQPPACHRAVT